jgi:NAD(P)-dependent dehydrogenase (short-subunit alcohol dehydrogenase family)
MTSHRDRKPGTRAALITGAARRIGRQIATDLAAQGYAVAIHYNGSGEDAAAVVEEIRNSGGQAQRLQGDLADPQVPHRLIREAVEAFGGLSLLVNNASRFEPDEIGSITLDSWSQHLDTNLRAPVFLAQAFAAALPPEASGNIINIVDQRVWKLNPRFFSYTLSKAALWDVTRTLAQGLAPRIRVNSIGPGPALPSPRMDQNEFEKQAALTLLQNGTSPKEISAAVTFILSAPAMTGQMIVLDGGQHLVWQTPDIMNVNE